MAAVRSSFLLASPRDLLGDVRCGAARCFTGSLRATASITMDRDNLQAVKELPSGQAAPLVRFVATAAAGLAADWSRAHSGCRGAWHLT